MKKSIVLIIAILILLIGSFTVYNKLSITTNIEDKPFEISSGSSLKVIANNLKGEGIIDSSNFFVLYAKSKGLENSVQAGKFIISPELELDELLKTLQNPQPEFTIVTIPEGYTVYQIGELLEQKGLVDKEEFLQLAREGLDEDLEDDLNDIYYKLEGYLYPDTYYIPNDYDSRQIIDMMMSRLDELFTKEYEIRADELGLTVNDVLTIASLIEREAASDLEKKDISGVIKNRLELDMRLQIDASVIYAIKRGEGHINRVLYEDLEFDSPYNTYKYSELPPGPIGSPGIISIEAALFPKGHEYVYYVFDGSEHVFSKTYNEHLKNVKKYIRN